MPTDFLANAKPVKTVPPVDFLANAKPVGSSIPLRPAGLPNGVELPQLPAHPAVNMNAPSTAASRLLGSGNLSDTAGVIGSHLKNLVAGPYHAFTDAPRNAEEAAEKGTGPDSGIIANGLGQIGLGAARMFVNPTRDALAALPSSRNATDVMNHLTDAIPVAGPWARSIEDEAQQKGVVPALAGAAIDVLGPEALGGVAKVGLRGVGLGTSIASATDASRNLAATRFLTKGTPGELLQSALKPGVKFGAGAGEMLEKSLPDVLEADPSLQGVSGFASASDVARDNAFHPYNDLIAPYRNLPREASGPVRPSAINGGKIADAQLKSIPLMDLIENPATPSATRTKVFDIPAGESGTMRMGAQIGGEPEGGIFNKTKGISDNYRKDLSIPALDEIRGDANGKLNAFYNKAGGDRAAALSNPETARVKAVGDTIRNLLYPQLESDAGLPSGAVADMQTKYGRLVDTSDIANKREPVFARHDPVTLSQKIVSGHGNPLSMAWNYAVQNKLGSLTNSDALVNSAIDRFQNPSHTPLVPRPGALGRIGFTVGQTLRKTPSIPLLANPIFLGEDRKR